MFTHSEWDSAGFTSPHQPQNTVLHITFGRTECRSNMFLYWGVQICSDNVYISCCTSRLGKMISCMFVNVFISPLSLLQKHRNFQYLPYEVKSQVSVSYYDVLLQYCLLVLALPDWCCEVRRGCRCWVLRVAGYFVTSVCLFLVSQGRKQKMLVGYQKVKNN